MKYSKHILFTLIAIIIIETLNVISTVGTSDMGNATYLVTFLNYISIGIFIKISFNEGFGKNEIPQTIQNLFKLWLLWNIFNLLRGAFLADDYWEWKSLLLGSLSYSLVPMTFFAGKNMFISKTIFSFVFKYLFPFGFLFIPLAFATNDELYPRLMIPISMFILFIPFVRLKWKILIIIVAATSALMVIGFRSNIIKITFSVLVLLIYYFKNYINQHWLRFVHLSLFSAPIILLFLAITGEYNIFEKTSEEEGYNTITSEGEEENLMADTRTFLYVDVFNTLNNSGNWLIGESAIGSYQSEGFYDDGGAMEGKRFGVEVGILSILLRNGVVGVLCYALLLFTVSYTAINHSSNILAKMVGLFIAFRFTYSFVEEVTQYDLNFYFFWLAIGLVSSVRFRNMSDNEIRKYFELQ